jgi:hypothetical protein
MEPSTWAFFDELEKIALDPLTQALIIQGATGAAELGFHGPWAKGGISPAELQSQRVLTGAEVGLRTEKDKKKAEKQVQKAMKRRAQAAEAAELAGSGLAMGGLQAGGMLGARQLGKSLGRVERTLVTTPQEMAQLRGAIAPGANVVTIPRDISSAMHIPKGGVLPRPLRRIEEQMYAGRGIPADVVRRGFEEGISVAPIRAGAHVGAHELGHAAVGATRLGRVGRFLRIPLGMGAGIGSGIVAMKGDPEGAASKYVAPALAAASVAPVLGEEAAASIKAIKGMRRAGFAQPAISKAKRQLAKAWGTYGLALGAPMIAAPFAIRAVKKYQLKRRKERGIPSYKELKQQYKERKEKK